MTPITRLARPLRGLMLLTCTVFATPALADDLLERLEAATETIGANQTSFYISRVPELADKMPSSEWDDEIRAASKCVLDGVRSAKGETVAQAYVAGLETDAATPITSMADLQSMTLPDELSGTDLTLQNLMQSCGTVEISAVRMKESGLWDMMMDPSVMQRIMQE